jgi:anti-sigma factor RsiW
MTCEETQHLLDAYVDGELDRQVKLVIDGHLHGCAHCASILASLRSLVSALKRAALPFKAPPHLKAQIQAIQPTHTSSQRSFARWLWAGSAAAVLLTVALVLIFSARTTESSLETRLIGEIVSSHARSLMANHLTDVPSSDTHTVKPWFADKLDYSPPAKDLSAQGFPLIGGRMDYVENRPVAALVYRRNQHFINLFVWPVELGQTMPDIRSTVRGYNLIHWTQDGMTYWLISDLEPAQLNECAGLLRK